MLTKSGLSFVGLSSLFLAICFWGCTGTDVQNNTTKKPDWYIPKDFGDQYYSETIRTIKEMWDNEQDHLDKITTKIAQTIRSGGTAIWDANAGHSIIFEADPELPCFPKGAMQSSKTFQGNKENIDKLKKGDILVTNFIWDSTYNAHERGVHVIGVTNSYFQSKKFGDLNKNLNPRLNNLMIDDISDEVFDSHADGHIGVVFVPYIQGMKVGPGISNYMTVLYWLMTTEVASKTVKGSDAPSLEYATQYIDILFERLDKIFKGQRDVIWSAATQVAEKIGKGGHYYVESEPEATKSDSGGMSMSLRLTNFFPKENIKQGDVIFLADVTDDPNSRMVQEAKAAKEKGVFIIAMGPSTQKELKTLADVYFDNLSPEGYGLFEIEGYENEIAMVGSLINNIIYNTFAMQMVYEMCRRGWYPNFYSSYQWLHSAGYHEWGTFCVNKFGY